MPFRTRSCSCSGSSGPGKDHRKVIFATVVQRLRISYISEINVFITLRIDVIGSAVTVAIGSGVVNLSICPLLFTGDLSGLQHKALARCSASPGRGSGGASPQWEWFFLSGPERWLAFCFGPVQCPSRSEAEAAVPPACPRRGKRERGRSKFLAAAGISLVPCSCCLPRHRARAQRPLVRLELSHHVRPIADRDPSVQMFVDRHRTSGQSMAEPALGDLPQPLPHRYRVVLRHYPLRLHRENPVQVFPPTTPECRTALGRLHLELPVEFCDIPLSQKLIGR